MKGLITSIFAVLVLSTTALAGNITPAKTSKSIVLDFADWKTEIVELSITDENGNTLYTEKIATDSKPKRFNFNKLDSGTYTIKTSNKNKVRRQVLVISKEAIKIEEVSVNFNPMITFDSNQWDVNYLSNAKSTSFYIIDSEGNYVYSASTSDQNIHKRFDIANLPKGEYTLSVSNEITSAYHRIIK